MSRFISQGGWTRPSNCRKIYVTGIIHDWCWLMYLWCGCCESTLWDNMYRNLRRRIISGDRKKKHSRLIRTWCWQESSVPYGQKKISLADTFVLHQINSGRVSVFMFQFVFNSLSGFRMPRDHIWFNHQSPLKKEISENPHDFHSTHALDLGFFGRNESCHAKVLAGVNPE